MNRKEEKHIKFKNILKRRLQNLSNQFRLISNLSNKSNYYYDDKELLEMFDKIEHMLEMLKHDYNFKKYEI